MVADSTEEEQIEALKNWFSDNGISLVVGIVLVLASVFGYRTWETNTREAAEAASTIYQELVQTVSVGPLGKLTEEQISTGNFLAGQLKGEYTDSTYAHFAAMHLARLAVEKGDLPRAAVELEWVLNNGVDDKLAIIVNYRLARVKLGEKAFEAAITQLDSVEPGGHLSSYEELRGDVYFEMDQKDKAREAYQRAINAQGVTIKPITQMKLDDIAAPLTDVAADAPDAAQLEESNLDVSKLAEVNSNGAAAEGEDN